MDPETALDAIRDVGIREGKIVVISASPLQGKQKIDAHGLVVAPGFIDLHEHGQEPRNYEFQAHDGVTTSLELELGTADVDAWYAKREGHSLINSCMTLGVSCPSATPRIAQPRPRSFKKLTRQSTAASNVAPSPSGWESTTPPARLTAKLWMCLRLRHSTGRQSMSTFATRA
jgi:hypothetical protein